MKNITVPSPKFFQEHLTTIQDLLQANKSIVWIFTNYYNSDQYCQKLNDSRQNVTYFHDILSEFVASVVVNKTGSKTIQLDSSVIDLIQDKQSLDEAKTCFAEVVDYLLNSEQERDVMNAHKVYLKSFYKSVISVFSTGHRKINKSKTSNNRI